MKHPLYRIGALSALILLLLAACAPQEKDPVLPAKTFEIEELQAPLPAEGGSVTLKVTSGLSYTVSMDQKTDWLTFKDDKSSVTLTAEANMEDYMREALLSFTGTDGAILGELGVTQKAGGGIVFEIEKTGIFSSEATVTTVSIQSNVDYDVAIEDGVTWLNASKVQGGISLSLAANDGERERSTRITFRRTGKDRLLGYLEIIQRGIIYNVKLNGEPLESIQDAIDKLPSLTEPALIELGFEPFTEPILLDGTAFSVPVTLRGQGDASETVVRSIEIYRASATLENITIAPEGTALPQKSTSYNYPFGLMVHEAGNGVTVKGVTFDMSGAADNATGMFWLGEARGKARDVLEDCTVKGVSGRRNAQIYGAFLSISGNAFSGGHKDYCIRIGNNGNDIIIDDNRFFEAGSSNASCVQFYNLSDSDIVIGNGEADTNLSDGSFKSVFGANADVSGNSFRPSVTYSDGIISVKGRLLSRVWGKYTTEDGTSWDANLAKVGEWDRNVAMTRDYICVPIAGRSTADYGVNVFNRADGSFYGKFSSGFDKDAGLFPTSSATIIWDDETPIVLVSNMVNNTGQVLKVYKLDPETGATETILRYTMPDGARLGDKMTVFGTWNSGYILFIDYNKGSFHNLHYFTITEGQVNPEPVIKKLNVDRDENNAHIGSLTYWGVDSGDNCDRWIYAGNHSPRVFGSYAMDFWKNANLSRVVPTEGADFEDNMNDPQFFTAGGQDYMCYVSATNVSSKATGYLRVVKIPGTSASNIESRLMEAAGNLEASSECYSIGHKSDVTQGGTRATNGTAFCQMLWIDGETYIVAGITGAGMSLFKVNH